MNVNIEELTLVCSKLNAQYDPSLYPPYGHRGHYSHKIYRLMEWAMEMYPDVVGTLGVEGHIEHDANGGGIYTLGYVYINAGDPYAVTITWRNSDPMLPHRGKFHVEGWADAQEEVEKIRLNLERAEVEQEEEIRIEIEVPRGWDSVETDC